MTAPAASGSGGSSGLLFAYATVAAASITAAGNVLATISVPAPGWYDVEATCQPGNTTTGVPAVEAVNVMIATDFTTSGTVADLQGLVIWNSAESTAQNAPVPTRRRVFAKTKIQLQAMGAATTSTSYLVQLSARPAAFADNDE